MTQEKQPVPSRSKLGSRLADIYALLTGLLGVLVLIRLLDYQTMSFDLLTLLPFTVLALLVSYFRVPIGRGNVELRFDGAILLGAMLTAGPVTGGWAAFITGLVSGILPFPRNRFARASLMEHVVAAALDGGRNVIAIGAAWMAYYWLGGTLKPPKITLVLALALILLCLSYVLVRSMLAWPVALFKSVSTRQALSEMTSTNQLLIEFIPLPVALLISPAFVQFGWIRFLTLALVLIGTSALMRQMVETIHSLQNRIDTMTLVDRIKQALRAAPRDTQTLCDLTRQFCAEIVPAQCEIGLYNKAMTQMTVQSCAEGNTIAPLIRIPITPFWEWAGQQREPILFETPAQFDALGLVWQALESGQKSQSALLVPILPKPAQEAQKPAQEAQKPAQEAQKPAQEAQKAAQDVDEQREAVPRQEHHPVGALLFQSPFAHVFAKLVVERIVILTDLISEAVQYTHALSAHTMRATDQQIARQIQSDLLVQKTPPIEGWDVAVAWEWSPQAKGIWGDFFRLPDRDKFVMVEPHVQGLSACLTAMLVHALIRSNHAKGTIDESETLEAINTYLLTTHQPTALLCVTLDQENILTLINAGCASPLWWHSEHKHTEVLRSEGNALGLTAGAMGEEKDIALATNDVLVLCTNSLLGVSNGQETFGQQRLIQALNQFAGRSASDLAATILAHVSDFCGQKGDLEHSFVDDVLLAVFCRREAVEKTKITPREET